MKKITLSAAILAMTMMGCSDMGVDNSVASTNDVKQEKSSANTVASLKKATIEETSLEVSYGHYTTLDNMSFAFYGSSDVEESYEKRGIGTFTAYASNGSKFDEVTGITLNVANCYYIADGAECQYIDWKVDRWRPVQSGQLIINQTSNVLNFIDRDRITSISHFSGVWHKGRNDEVTLSGSTYSGYLNDTHNPNMAVLVAQKYFPMAWAEFDGIH